MRHLEALGERVVEETARTVIREQVASGGQAVPWIDPPAYARLTAGRDAAAFDAVAKETGRVFFDRGILDSYGVEGAPPWPELETAVRMRRYNPCVFVFPPWREIYQTDAERRQDWDEAERTFGKIQALLPRLGYRPLIVPKGSVAERADFVLSVALREAPCRT